MTADKEFTRTLSGAADRPTLTFERRYSAGREELWRALTDGARLARWFGTLLGAMPQGPGDSFAVDLGNGPDDLGRGTITRCVRARAVAYDWVWQDEQPSHIEVTLDDVAGATDVGKAAAGGTLLRLVHSLVEARHAAGYGGGWEQVLLALDDEVSGTPGYAPRFAELEAAGVRAWRQLLGEQSG